ncbi:MAG: SusC/RagA family TonB-linked outer membrane protein [Arenibacter algicola]
MKNIRFKGWLSYIPFKMTLKMKLTTILLIVSLFKIQANSYSQNAKISLDYDQISIGEVFKEIERKSEFRFLYKNKELDGRSKVSIHISKGNIYEILDRLFKELPIKYEVLDNRQIILTKRPMKIKISEESIPVGSLIEQISVSGSVVDVNGTPLPGANILEKGTSNGTQADFDGNFSISVKDENAVFVVSYIGFASQEITVNGQTELTVVLLENASTLEEVVLVGYGTAKRSDLLSAQSGVKAAELKDRSTTTLSEALLGKMAGVTIQNVNGTPGQETTINIRGKSSLGSGTQPLYVIDGIISSSITNLNSSDIESLEVIKDAASAAIYGARGANGVVLITTKSGSEGKTNITVNVSAGMQSAERLYPIMTSAEYYEYNNWYWNYYYILQGGDPSLSWEQRPASQRTPAWINSLDPNNLPDVDWNKEYYRSGLMQDYEVTASGGTDKVKYYLSGRFADQEFIEPNTDYQRVNFRAKIDVDINSWLHAGINLSPTFTKANGTSITGGNRNAVYDVIYIPPTTRLNENYYAEGVDFTFSVRNPVFRKNAELDLNRSIDNSINAYIKVDLLKNLYFKSTFGYATGTVDVQIFNPSTTTNYNAQGYFNHNYSRSTQLENLLNYDTEIKSHNINVILGQSFQDGIGLSSTQSKRGFPTDIVRTLNAGTIEAGNSTSAGISRLASYFGRVRYSFADKYLLNITSRYDGSHRFGPLNKWGFFPSVSAGWKISEENFMENVSWLDLLKIRASYGISGNDQIGDFRWLNTLNSGNYNLNGQIAAGYAEAGAVNESLSWEEIKTMNLGLDFNILKNRFQVSTNYYVNNNDKSILSIPLPSQSGFESFLDNTGRIENKGFELEMFGNFSLGQIQWSPAFNFSTNKNTVKDIPVPFNLNQNGVYARTEEGRPLNSWYMWVVDGLLTQEDIDSGYPTVPGALPGSLKYVDVNEDGVWDDDDRTFVGQPSPKYFYGLTNNFEFKNIDLSIFFQGARGGHRLEGAARPLDYGGSGLVGQWGNWAHGYRGPDNPGDGRTPLPDRISKIPLWSTYQLYKSDYLKLRTITLGYTFSQSLLDKVGVSGARIYVSGENIYTWFGDKNFKGVNAESDDSYGNSENTSYADYTTTPLTRKIRLGLNLTF